MIDPQDVIDKFTVEELCSTAENYFARISDPTPQMAKPFCSFQEAPSILKDMGRLLSGLRIGKTMTVMDFGAGTCWFSRFLNQLHCKTISCDVSRTALELGKRLFREQPIIGEAVFEPSFLHFDGRRIDLPDESVDRILCLHSFHHVPNQERVVSEMARVLKTGGIAGFAEPGRHHSRNPMSQYEMKNYNVLENDIDVARMFSIAERHGFSDIEVELLCDMKLSMEQWRELTASKAGRALRDRLVSNARDAMNNSSVFFLFKGEFVPDSRSHEGLAHSIGMERTEYEIAPCRNLRIDLEISNKGQARWLTENTREIGTVKIGTHLYDEKGGLLDLDFSRHPFEKAVNPGETLKETISVEFARKGVFDLSVDLVSEGICWFENVGSRPVRAKVRVR